ncbi:MAG TPA: rhomboid family intramembrane serine protease, partial [Thermoanaerobaculia bacterium]|nr:rhomboid family intramembrane serine protease [Thermoanaerobaculia bacterium]
PARPSRPFHRRVGEEPAMIPLRDLNPSRTLPVVTVTLIAVNVLLFFYELSLGPELQPFVMQAAFVPARYLGGGPLALIPGFESALLSMFLHGGWAHIAGNMLFLWIFGDNVEDRLGHFRFLVFYLAAGFVATATQALVSPDSGVPQIGASGAISGVLGAYLFLFPRARVVTLLFLGFFVQLIRVPAMVFLPLWFLLQFFSGIASLGAPSGQGGVAFFAHIGGFIAGPLLLLLLGGRRPPSAPVSW